MDFKDRVNRLIHRGYIPYSLLVHLIQVVVELFVRELADLRVGVALGDQALDGLIRILSQTCHRSFLSDVRLEVL